MPYQLGWYIPHQVICAQVTGEQTLAEGIEFNEKVLHMLEEGTSIMYVLAFIEVKPDFSIKPTEMRDTLKYMSHPRMGWLIVVNKQLFVRFFVTLLTQLMGTRVRLFQSQEKALEFLQEMDGSLDWEKADTQILDNFALKT